VVGKPADYQIDSVKWLRSASRGRQIVETASRRSLRSADWFVGYSPERWGGVAWFLIREATAIVVYPDGMFPGTFLINVGSGLRALLPAGMWSFGKAPASRESASLFVRAAAPE
jgi:hypothetical protein